MCVPGWTAAEPLAQGQLLAALALHSCTHVGTGQKAWWWCRQSLSLPGTGAEGSAQVGEDPIPQN